MKWADPPEKMPKNKTKTSSPRSKSVCIPPLLYGFAMFCSPPIVRRDDALQSDNKASSQDSHIKGDSAYNAREEKILLATCAFFLCRDREGIGAFELIDAEIGQRLYQSVRKHNLYDDPL